MESTQWRPFIDGGTRPSLMHCTACFSSDNAVLPLAMVYVASFNHCYVALEHSSLNAFSCLIGYDWMDST